MLYLFAFLQLMRFCSHLQFQVFVDPLQLLFQALPLGDIMHHTYKTDPSGLGIFQGHYIMFGGNDGTILAFQIGIQND